MGCMLIPMTTRYQTTRRGALQLFGASAAIISPVSAFAAQGGPSPLLSLTGVPLAWPLYHRLGASDGIALAGDRVVLERDVAHPSGRRGIAVHRLSGETIGFVTDRHHGAIDWAMQRGGAVEAEITAVDRPVVAGKRVPGWGGYRIDITVDERAALV